MDSLIENLSKLDTTADEGQTENRCPVKVSSPSLSLPESYKTPRTLTEANLDLLESKRYTDVTFIVGSTRSRFPCHKLILIARSPEFARLFGPREDGGKELKEYEIPDTTHYIFPLFLKFIYTDTFVGISRMQAVDLLYLACKFKVGLLEEHCVMYLLVENVNLPVAPSVFAAAQKTQLTDLCDLALDIMAKDFETVLSSTEFLNLDHGTQETILKQLLERNNLPGREMDILHHVIKWGKRCISHQDDNNEKLKNNLSSILPLIRFTKMRMFEFANYVVPMNVLPHDIVLNILTYLGATGSVRAEDERKLNDLHFSTTPRYPTISTVSVIAPVSFYCTTATSEEPQTRELGPLFETLRFRVQLKTVAPVNVNQDQLLLLTRIYLNLPQGLNASAKAPTTKQTEKNKKMHVEVQKLSSSLHAKQVILTPSMVYGPNERLEVMFSPAIELLDGFDYCIVVEDATSTKSWYKCSPCGVLKSYIWIKGLESVAKLCDIQRNAYRCVEPDLGVSIIRGLELQMAGPENSQSVATALKEPVNFQFSFVKTSSDDTPSMSSSTVSTTASSVGFLACTTPKFGSPAITATSTLGSPAIPTTSKLGSQVTTTTATLGSMAITTSAMGSPAMKTTTKFASPVSIAPSLVGSAVSTTPSLFGSAVSTTPSLFGSSVISLYYTITFWVSSFNHTIAFWVISLYYTLTFWVSILH